MLILILCAASTFTFHGDAHAHQAALRMELNGGRGVGQPCTVGSPVAPLGRSRGCLGIMSSVEKPKNELQLPLGALSAGLTAAIEAAVELEARDFAKATPDLRALELEEEELEGHKSRLLTELGDIQTTGLVFQSDGTPSASTLGIALVLTARRVSERKCGGGGVVLATVPCPAPYLSSSDQARPPAELKHINKRRRRN